MTVRLYLSILTFLQSTTPAYGSHTRRVENIEVEFNEVSRLRLTPQIPRTPPDEEAGYVCTSTDLLEFLAQPFEGKRDPHFVLQMTAGGPKKKFNTI